MSVDKVLHKIQIQINDIVPALENFVEHTIQPTVDDCEALQSQLNHLQEELIIYKYLRINKELSPSYNIHSKISEAEPVPEKVQEQAKIEETAPVEVKETAPVIPELKEVIIESIKSEPAFSVKPFTVAINDKFRFINELFSQNASEYNIAVEQINSLRTWHDAEIYLNSLRNLYTWKENSDVVKHFYTLIKKRYN